jgi:seryl-tRNA(Sec) selenium transferase
MKPVAGSAEALAAALRSGKPAVVGRLEADQVLLDLRSVQPRDDAQLVAALSALRREKSEESVETPQLPTL